MYIIYVGESGVLNWYNVVKRCNVYKTSSRPRIKYCLCSSYVDCFFLAVYVVLRKVMSVTFCFSTTRVRY